MGMTASQARLLSITARLSNNEHSAQSISYAKQRLADETEQITKEYNEALNATKLTILTGFNGSQANYDDISYHGLTRKEMAESTRQYVVTDTKNRILVTEEIAKAYDASRGDYNAFLAQLGYSQSDLAININSTDTVAVANAKQLVHEAWDKYFESVGIECADSEHSSNIVRSDSGVEVKFNWVSTVSDGAEEGIGFGYVTYNDGSGDMPINYEGSTAESKNLFDYAKSITESFYRVEPDTPPSDSIRHVYFDSDAYHSAVDSNYTSDLKYYTNIFNRIQQRGYFTYTSDSSQANGDNYIYAESASTAGNVSNNPLVDNSQFEKALRNGTLRLEYYSTVSKSFVSITVSEDNCIQEVPDERAIAKAEVKYTQDMNDIEKQDKKFDLNLKRLDTEHNALQTEYDSMKTIIDKNIENSFKTFS